MKTVGYRGYQASVEFEDGTLFVKVLHISDLLIGECDSASEAEATAARLIEDYLDLCKELGKDPEQPFKGSFNVRISPEIHRRVAMAAANEGVSLNSWVNSAVNEKLECDTIRERYDRVLSKRDDDQFLFNLQKVLVSSSASWHGSSNRGSSSAVRGRHAAQAARGAIVRSPVNQKEAWRGT